MSERQITHYVGDACKPDGHRTTEGREGMVGTSLIEEVRRYPPDAIFPYPWKVEPSPQVDETLGWSVLDADGTEIFTVHDEEVANALAAVPQFVARIDALEEALRSAPNPGSVTGFEADWRRAQAWMGKYDTWRQRTRALLDRQNTASVDHSAKENDE